MQYLLPEVIEKIHAATPLRKGNILSSWLLFRNVKGIVTKEPTQKIITKRSRKCEMNSFTKLTSVVISFASLLILAPDFSLAFSCQAQCTDVATRGYLNVLTINLLFSEIKDRETRLKDIANFIAEQREEEEPVDVVLLQEVVGGPLSGTINSSLDLKRLLAERGMKYNLRYRLANGLPGILTVGNAILSRCKILFTISKTLPFVSEEPFEGFEIPLRRKVMMCRIKVPYFGKINVYNTHLCAFCDSTERLEQTEVLSEFIENVENFIWGENPIILGGDFNANLNIPDDLPVYELITRNLEFIDTYATANDCTDCCSEEEGYLGCTYAVPGNPYSGAEEPKRIDYIFIKGVETDRSVVVFDSYPWVSDHSGVLTRIRLLNQGQVSSIRDWR